MLHSKIEFNEDIATDVRLFNPFGPNMFYMSLNDSYIEKLLRIINKLSSQQDIKDKLDKSGQIVHGTRAKELQKNSIVNGEIYGINLDYLNKDDSQLIVQLITTLTLLYGNTIHSHVQKDIALIDDNNAIELLKDEAKSFKVKIEALWYVKMKQGDYHVLHEHSASGAIFSGAIYLDVPDIPWPQGNMNWIPPGGRNTMYNETWQVHPKRGDVFMWPSWLLHTVYPFRSEKERIMISFNSILLSEKQKGV